ncbi:MAG TPA: M23 family metallopeptidase [Anaerolineales bacterium]|nr:M23 family metallopeptidase [Anaerolineales bacterium]
MKRVFYFVFALLIVACNLPATENSTSEPVNTATLELPTATPSLAPSATATLIPPTLTATPVPCDPLAVDYCITSGHFLFQRPIHLPDNETVDLTYLYASTSNGKRDPHHGVEYQNPFGTSVFAAGDGEVVFADADKKTKFSPWNNFYGNVIVIRHADEMYTLYAHLSEILVQVGDQVQAGDEIGKVGQTGGATGSHLHFEVRKGGDYTDYFSTENPELWTLPPEGTGALSITLKTTEERNYERQLVITRLEEGSQDILFTYYITTYAKGFEHNVEDSGLGNLPAGQYKIAFTGPTGFVERLVLIEAGRLTEVVFDLQ